MTPVVLTLNRAYGPRAPRGRGHRALGRRGDSYDNPLAESVNSGSSRRT